MKRIFSIIPILIFVWILPVQAQLPHGASAPDFTVTDISGNSFNLFSQTSQGKGVIIDLFATWCGPCWSFHNSGVIQQVLNNLGSFSTAIALEADYRTNTGCILNSGCNYSTLGNWATVPYQIANLTTTNGGNVKTGYALSYYPTVYVISHDNRAYEIRNKSYGVFRSWLQESFFLDANPVIGHANCGGDGFIRLNRTKGYGAISYNWSNGATTEDIAGVDAGTYSVTVTDQNGYDKVFGPFVVSGPAAALSVDLIEESDVSCFQGQDGLIEVQGYGGNQGYQYAWSNGPSGPVNANLTTGYYTLTLTDVKGCQAFEQFYIDQPSELTVSASTIAASCDRNNGEIIVGALGGIPPYVYDIGEGAVTDPIFTDLLAGDYTITVTDVHDCTNEIDVTVKNIEGPEAHAGPDIEMDCAFPSLILAGSASMGADITYYWQTQDGTIKGDSTELEVEILSPGTYVFFVTDEILGCVAIDTVVVADGRSYPEFDFASYHNLNCLTTSTWLAIDSVDNGRYEWTTTTGNFVRDIDSLATEVDAPGWYFLSVTDTLSSCITTDSIEVVEDVALPEFIIRGKPHQGCPDEVINLSIEDLDTLGSYQFEWSTADGRIINGTDQKIAEVDLFGTYTAQVTDEENGCDYERVFRVARNWNVATADFGAAHSGLAVSFADLSEGDNLTWRWTFGDGNMSQDQNPRHTYASEGTYDVCLIVSNECGQSDTCRTIEVSENRGPLEVADVEILDVDCFGNNTGKINLEISGGYFPYEINWSNGDTGRLITDLPADTYEARIRDNKDNEVVASYTVKQPERLEVLGIDISGDNGQDSGEIYLEITGGTGTYAFEWSDGSTDNPATGLKQGDYSCLITDEQGCEMEIGPVTVPFTTSLSNAERGSVTIYPNPVIDQLCLEVKNLEIISVHTTNSLGETVNVSWKEGMCTDVAGLQNGIYLTTVRLSDGKVRMAKWVKSN